MIRLEKVNKYFNKSKSNEIHVINNTTMRLPSHGIVTLLGPSGCGKTTLLNAVGGLDKVNSGKIYIDEECITGKSSGRIDDIRNARIGYIFQNFNLLDDKTVFENVEIALKMIGIKDKEVRKERVNYCLKSVNIYQYRFKRADALSGGQRQRVAIARAIVKNPSIIIADEPTGNLDSANTLEVMNIIKQISKDRLVLLVTHERNIAEFYADHVCELKDGKIVNAYNNDSSRYLDYQLENKLYLKDMPMQEHFEQDGIKIGLYGEKDRTADIKLVIKGGNLYIDTNGAYNVVDEHSKVEMIDDHYSMLDSSIYEDNDFDYAAYLPEDFKPKYTSLYTPLNLLVNGFRTLLGFKKLKKFLLVGFVFAAMFIFFAVSNIAGLLDVKESDFLTTNDHYVSVANTKHNAKLLDEVASMDGSKYVIPGDSRITVDIPLNDYMQTSMAQSTADVSLTYASTITSKDVVYGDLPKAPHEVVLDRMVADKYLEDKTGAPVGLTTEKQFVGRILKVGKLSSFKIVGIADTNSPSLYAFDSDVIHMVINGVRNTDGEDMMTNQGPEAYRSSVTSYDLRSSNITIKKGRAPNADYEVVVNKMHEGEYELNKTINMKVNGTKLKVVGFYEGGVQDDYYFVTTNTTKLGYIANTKSMSVYTDDVNATKTALEEKGLSCKINYDRDKAKYQKSMQNQVKSAMALAAIILAISLIEMFLMLRSSFLARIKEVGTLRAIGLKKKDIYSMFAGEILAISIVTSIPGIGIMYYMISNIVRITPFLASQYIVNPIVAIIAFVLIIGFNLLVGLIPVMRVLSKTPAAILSRTDI